jgi:hypothetical protein
MPGFYDLIDEKYGTLYLIALLIRLFKICSNLTEFPITAPESLLSTDSFNGNCFSVAFSKKENLMLSNNCTILNSVTSNFISSFSIALKSSISSKCTSRLSPDNLIACKYPSCSVVGLVCNNNSVKPIIAFIGVRTSWLIVDKNCDLATTAWFLLR